MNTTRIFLVDDHPLVREWLTNLINQQEDLTVCGEAETVEQARTRIEATRPDVAIIDLSLSYSSGIELIKDLRIRLPDLKMIVLSMHDEMTYAERVLRAGARGYVMKRETTGKIVTAIHDVLAGRLAVSDRISQSMAERYVGGVPAGSESPMTLLSDRELEVFQLLGKGQETRQIAEELHLSLKTVQTYCARTKEKLKLANATELLHEAFRWSEQRQRM